LLHLEISREESLEEPLVRDHRSAACDPEAIVSAVGRRDTGERFLQGAGGKLNEDSKDSVDELRGRCGCHDDSGSTTITLLSSEMEVIARPMVSTLDDLRLDKPLGLSSRGIRSRIEELLSASETDFLCVDVEELATVLWTA
jgi:hypothetical protein